MESLINFFLARLGNILPSRSVPKGFPKAGIGLPKVLSRLDQARDDLRGRKVSHNLGWLYTLPHPVATTAYKYFIEENPNHLGNWSFGKSQTWATYRLEQEVIRKMIDLYHGNLGSLEGYITSGGTEANLFSAWAGRVYLEKRVRSNQICLLKTSLTHYSIRKCAEIVSVPQFILPLNDDNWNLDQNGLGEKVEELHHKGYRGFLLPLTIGYTQTGTSDNVVATIKTVKRLEGKLPDVKFFLWIDAALNGMIAPFLEEKFSPFSSKLIKTLVVDFHKFGLVPYPAGIIIYRKELRSLIEKPIDYLPEADNTVLGSRSGVPAASVWAMIHYLGKESYQKMAREQLDKKKLFTKELKSVLPTVQIISSPKSLSCGVIFPSLKGGRLPKRVEEKYGLFAKKTKFFFYQAGEKEHLIYKFFFLPHLGQKAIQELIADIKEIL